MKVFWSAKLYIIYVYAIYAVLEVAWDLGFGIWDLGFWDFGNLGFTKSLTCCRHF
jgi:hypothetical protein